MATPPSTFLTIAFLLLLCTTAPALLSSLHQLTDPVITDSTAPSESSVSFNSTMTTWRSGLTTIFAPSDSSLLTCGRFCSLPRLLPKHSVPGYLPFRRLSNLPFSTKIQTLHPDHCLTVNAFLPTPKSNRNSTKIFISSIEITHPDLFDDGLVLVHGLKGIVPSLPFRFIQRLPLYRSLQRLLYRFLSPPPPPRPDASIVLRLLSEQAIRRLRLSGYSLVADALGLGVGLAGNALDIRL